MPKPLKPARPAKVVPKGKNIGIVVNVNADEIVQYTPTQMDALAAAVDLLADALSRPDEDDDEDVE